MGASGNYSAKFPPISLNFSKFPEAPSAMDGYLDDICCYVPLFGSCTICASCLYPLAYLDTNISMGTKRATGHLKLHAFILVLAVSFQSVHLAEDGLKQHRYIHTWNIIRFMKRIP